MLARTRTSLRFYGLMAALALALTQLVVASHALADDHSAGERCQICLSAERFDHPLPDTAVALAGVAPPMAVAAAIPAPHPIRRPATQRTRAPPTL